MNMVAGVGGEEREVAVKCDYVVGGRAGVATAWSCGEGKSRCLVDRWAREMDCRRRADCPQETSSSGDAPAPAALFEEALTRAAAFPTRAAGRWTRLSSKQQAARRAMHHS